MNKIMMTKYGFVRWPEQDFSDDGNRFTCYRIGKRVRVSKLVSNGRAYIDGSIDGIKLPYTVYSDLPHYLATGKLNGVPVATLTDSDLFELAEACLMYEKEYEEAENTIVMPSTEEIKARCEEIKRKLAGEVRAVQDLIGKDFMSLAAELSTHEWNYLGGHLRSLKRNLDNYDIDAIVNRMYGTADSIKFCSDLCYDLKPSWYYSEILKVLAKWRQSD